MEGSPAPGILNYLSKHQTLGDRVDNAALIQSLIEHPGWEVLDQIVVEFEERGESDLANAAKKAALACEPSQSIDYAQKRGLQSGLTFHRDVVASVLESAKKAAAELRQSAALDAAAEGN